MLEIKPFIPNQKQNYEDSLWLKSECYRFYVQQRRLYCNYMQLLDLWLLSPFCEECLNNEPHEESRIPDILPDGWELDIICEVGFATLERTKEYLSEDPDYSFRCKRCLKELAPWNGDEVYIVKYHLEEHYGIPLFTPNKRKPSRKIQNQILKLYDNKCFCCNTVNSGLHIDHIEPQSKGGDAAFRNLQPLCERCGNMKGDKSPEVIEKWNTSYFGPYPPDSYEHLFW